MLRLLWPREPRPPRLRCASLAVAVAAGAALAVSVADAAPAQAPQPAPASQAPTALDQNVRHILARQLVRIALMDLRATASPAQADYEAAAIILGIAHELNPGDQDILRKYIDAAYNAGREALVIDLTRTLLDLDPQDTVAWLRLISATISQRHQVADDRLRAYEALLGEQGRSLDASIRSRLALDAALLLRERGDEQGFIQKLTLATQLDSSHKEAAALAANVIVNSGQGPAATLEALSVLLMADPVDPNVHLGIARHLAASRAFTSASRFHTNALRILQVAGNVPDQVLIEHRILQWHVEGPAAVAEGLARELLVAQDAAARAIELARRAKMPMDGMQRPEDIRLPMHVGALAVLSATAAGDDAAARGALADMANDISAVVQALNAAVLRGEIAQEQSTRALVSALIQIQTVRLWSGHQLDIAAADHESNRELIEQHNPTALRLHDGWLALNNGRYEEAIEILEPFAEDNTFALFGIAQALEALGRTDQAIAEYERIVRRAPLEAAGAWARGRLAALDHVEDQRETRALERIAAAIPAWVDRLVTAPREFIQLSAVATSASVEGLDQNRIQISIRNLSPIPLALGADRTLNTRILLAPKLDLEGDALEQLIRPEVVDLDRRLRLMPREVLTVEVWPDPGVTGWITEVLANRTVRVRWRAIQGFILERVGGFRPGPMSQVSETQQVLRRPHPEASLTPGLLASRITNDPIQSLPGLAGAIRTQLLQPLIAPRRTDVEVLPGEPGREARIRLRTERMDALRPAIEALADRYPTLPPVYRAALVAIMPHTEMSPLVAAFDQVVLADNDPLVMSVVLVTRIASPEDEYLARAAETGDDRLRLLSESVAERLRSTADFYARLTPGRQRVGGGGAQR